MFNPTSSLPHCCLARISIIDAVPISDEFFSLFQTSLPKLLTAQKNLGAGCEWVKLLIAGAGAALALHCGSSRGRVTCSPGGARMMRLPPSLVALLGRAPEPEPSQSHKPILTCDQGTTQHLLLLVPPPHPTTCSRPGALVFWAPGHGSASSSVSHPAPHSGSARG